MYAYAHRISAQFRTMSVPSHSMTSLTPQLANKRNGIPEMRVLRGFQQVDGDALVRSESSRCGASLGDQATPALGPRQFQIARAGPLRCLKVLGYGVNGYCEALWRSREYRGVVISSHRYLPREIEPWGSQMLETVD